MTAQTRAVGRPRALFHLRWGQCRVLKLPASAARAIPAAAAEATAFPSRSRGLGDLDLQGSAAERIAVELPDRRVGCFGRGHLGETEAARSSSLAVHDDCDVVDAADLVKECPQLLGGCAERKTADEKLLVMKETPTPLVNHAPWNSGGERQSVD